MKKLPLTLLFLTLALHFATAQESTATKEQTINYLKENFFNKTIYNHSDAGEAGSKKSTTNYIYKFVDVNFDGCLLKIIFTREWSKEYNYAPPKSVVSTVEVMLDFTKIETINEVNTVMDEELDMMYELKFVHNEGNEKHTDISLPFASYKFSSSSNYVVQDTQIYKAFNHLRKLCGAPEPIKF